MESSRTSLASRTSSRTHFEVLGLDFEGQVLGLEASSPRKLACPRLEDSTIFWIVKFCGSPEKFFGRRRLFSGDRLKNFCEDIFFFWRALALVSLVLGLGSSIPVLCSRIPVLCLESVCPRKGCPWPWPRIFLCSWPRALCPRLHL